MKAINCICVEFKLQVCRRTLKNENAKQIKIISLRSLAKRKEKGAKELDKQDFVLILGETSYNNAFIYFYNYTIAPPHKFKKM